MKLILLLLSLSAILGISNGQGGQSGGEVIWNDNIDLDEIGSSPIISISNDMQPYQNQMQYSNYQGAGASTGGTAGEKAGAQEYSGDTDNTKNLLLKHPLTLECKVVHGKDVKVDVNWFKNDELLKPDNDHYKFDRENSTLSVASASKDDVGVYRCETTNLPETHSFEINVIYFVTKSMPKSQTVLQGDKLALTCEVEGDPMPEITWLKDENDVVDVVNASRYTLNENEKGVANASLVIASAEYEDRADYTCMASIAGIKYNTTTYVRVKDMYDALWPFLGICAEVFILCVIIFIYEKRRAKADFDESDTDPQTEQKSHADQNKDSVRQRK